MPDTGTAMDENILIVIAKSGYFIAYNIWRIFETLFRIVVMIFTAGKRYKESRRYR